MVPHVDIDMMRVAASKTKADARIEIYQLDNILCFKEPNYRVRVYPFNINICFGNNFK